MADWDIEYCPYLSFAIKLSDDPEYPSMPGKKIPSKEDVFAEFYTRREFPTSSWCDTFGNDQVLFEHRFDIALKEECSLLF